MGEAKRRKLAGACPEKTGRPVRPANSSVEELTWRLDGAPDEHSAAAECLKYFRL